MPTQAEYAIKAVALLRPRRGMSREEFVRRYEERHAPLVLDTGHPYIGDYRRSYLLPQPALSDWLPKPLEDVDFAVITEMWFRTREDYDGFRQALEEKRDIIRADEEELFDTESVQSFIVEEYVSET